MKRVEKEKFAVVGVAIFVLCIGCSSGQKHVSRVGEEKIVEESRKQPDWINQPVKNEKDKVYFVGTAIAVLLEDSETDARMEGMKKITDAVVTEVDHAYEKARIAKGLPKDDENIGRIVKDGLRIVSEAVISGVELKDFYYRKVERLKEDGSVGYFYHYWVLLEVPKEELLRAAYGLYEEQKRALQEANNKKAEEFLEEMKKQLGYSKLFKEEKE